MQQTQILDINQIIDTCLSNNTFGENFQFRKGQRETITSIVEAYIEDPESTVVIDAPTGTGKSLIAMWCSYIFKEMGKRGYLLTSDLSLQDQYEHDFYKFKLGWPSIRGIDNYDCHVNGLKFSLGECRMRNMGYEQAEKQLQCAAKCDYIQTRKRSIDLPVTLLNYSFWLIQRNYVAKRAIEREVEPPFGPRDFVFFDEAHQVDQIVQNHFTPRIPLNLVDTLMEVRKFLKSVQLEYPHVSPVILQEIVDDLFKSQDNSVLFIKLKQLKQYLHSYRKTKNDVDKLAKKQFGKNLEKPMTAGYRKAYGRYDFIKDIYCKIDDYIEIIKDAGVDSMVFDQKEKEVRFMCIKESKMIQKYLHEQARFKVFMSATIGSPHDFVKIMGIKKAKIIRLDEQFSYQKSPIVFVNKYKLSFRERENNFKHVANMLDKIIEKHKGQRGIIHTGSYSFSTQILEHSRHRSRLIKYTDSRQKKMSIEAFKSNPGSILIGPSILEGLDLKDDISRFQVFFKVPYPSLGDPLIKAKLKAQPNWYNWKTVISLLQGVGRSVRNENDWAVTYILDACFESLLMTPNVFPESFKNRIKIIEK
jgi:ATP-dependent DNA helicase DinG